DGTIVVGDHILRSSFQADFQDSVFVGPWREGNTSKLIEQISHGAVRSQVAAGLGKGMAHIAGGAVAVVRHGFDQYRDATEPVPFIGQLFNIVVVIVAHTAGNGPVDGVARHVGR